MNLKTSIASFALAAAVTSLAANTAQAVHIQPGDFLPGASIIDFETGSTALPNVPGVTFLGGFNGATGFGGVALFTQDLIGSQAFSNLESVGYSDLGLSFSTAQPAVGAYVGHVNSSGPNQLTVKVYGDVNGTNLLEQDVVTLPPVGQHSYTWLGFARPEGIRRIEWLGNNQGFFGVDNVTYGAANVPEPAAIGGIGAIGGLLLSRRRAR